MSNDSVLTKAEEEAVEWAILLADNPDDVEQLKHFEVWLRADPLHIEVWCQTLRVYDQLGQLSATTRAGWPQAAGTHESIADKRTARKRVFDRNRLIVRSPHWKKNLVGLALVVSLMIMVGPQIMLNLSAEYLTGAGERQTHILEDGTSIYLAPKSAVDIEFTQTERLVRLLEGSVFFEVVRDSGRPFRVDASGTKTTVLGTAFNVEKSGTGVVIGVAHGNVKVEDRNFSPAVTTNLLAGDQLMVMRNEYASLSRVAPDDIARWRTGELIVRDLSVGEVVEKFRDYYGGIIVVTKPFAEKRVTGLYKLDDPVDTLTNLAQAHEAKIRRITPWLMVLGQ
ncbi:MAG: FecR domain-containing protein [Cellvibrionaceae bacterium]|nr:FecR domain-containing protein [Cellvibrionaceae bacterium]